MNDKINIVILVVCSMVVGYCIRYLQECFVRDPDEPEPRTAYTPPTQEAKETTDAVEELAPPEHPKGESVQTHEHIIPRAKRTRIITYEPAKREQDYSIGGR